MATEINISAKRGDTRRHVFVMRDVDGLIVDISGWATFLMTLVNTKAPVDGTNQVEQIAGALVTDGTDGRVFFSPAGTTAIGKYFYDCQAQDDNAEKNTFAEGEYIVTQDRTKD